MSGRFGEAMVLRPGMVLAGKYSLTREIGRGAVGLVFEAEHLRLRQKFAVKALNGHLKHETELVQRFEREARAMALIKSPHITSVFDVDTTPDGTPYMVMELLEGHDLQRELRERAHMPVPDLVRCMLQACEGLAIVHEAGIVHRDLKPSNLFLARENGGHVLKLMDFGISKLEGDEATLSGASVGTPAYMSPEQVRTPSDVDARSDLWSLGVIMFRALTGVLPFDGEGITGMSVAIVTRAPRSLRALRPDVPEALARIVDRLLERDRDRRMQTARELHAALLPLANMAVPGPTSMSSLAGMLEPSIQASTAFTPSSPPGVSSTVTSRKRAMGPWALAAAVAVLLAVIAVAPWLVQKESARKLSPAAAVPPPPPLPAPVPVPVPVPDPPAAPPPPAPDPTLELDVTAPSTGASSAPPSTTKRKPRVPTPVAPAAAPAPPKKPELPTLL